jgi:hypothetical protein
VFATFWSNLVAENQVLSGPWRRPIVQLISSKASPVLMIGSQIRHLAKKAWWGKTPLMVGVNQAG